MARMALPGLEPIAVALKYELRGRNAMNQHRSRAPAKLMQLRVRPWVCEGSLENDANAGIEQRLAKRKQHPEGGGAELLDASRSGTGSASIIASLIASFVSNARPSSRDSRVARIVFPVPGAPVTMTRRGITD
jgi:hypothetical protein